jgi:hypothetical protein
MAGPKKKDIDEPTNVKIQRKFDLIFPPLEDTLKPDPDTHEDMSMSQNAQKKVKLSEQTIAEIPTFDRTASSADIKTASEATKLAAIPDDNNIDFSLDFGNDLEEISSPSSMSAASNDEHASMLLDIDTDGSDFVLESNSTAVTVPKIVEKASSLQNVEQDPDTMFDEAIADAQDEINDGTQKTLIFNRSQLSESKTFGSDSGLIQDSHSTAELMSHDEARANIDATIKSILRPKNFELPKKVEIPKISEIDEIDEISEIGEIGEIDEISNEIGDFSVHSNDDDDDDEDDDKTRISSEETAAAFNFNDHSLETSHSLTGEFDLNSVDFDNKSENEEVEFGDIDLKESVLERELNPSEDENIDLDEVSLSSDDSEDVQEVKPVVTRIQDQDYIKRNPLNDEESTRFQATIRQLRDERELLLGQIKTFKGDARELEQDNLTLKAALDESQIEISILRKRHMVELEEIKYRLSVNDEKKSMALEQAKIADDKRMKLEQRVRIDFNLVKQREKELETKLEMQSIDVDAQIQNRDQKILELRRKIDALEFNMENISIKEQKSKNDKRKLEDKLNKIMKTLRHSIKNLEDDIDQVNEEAQDDKNNDDYQSGKA